MSFGFVALADEDASQSTVKIDDVNGSANKVAGEDVDETLTNAKLRAETGSKSRFSIATAFSYDGGSLNAPLAAKRPNVQGVTGATTVADLNGTINAKYNITQKDSLLVGGGLRWVTPLQGSQRSRHRVAAATNPAPREPNAPQPKAMFEIFKGTGGLL